MNTQPRHPKCRALPVEPHPVIHFSVIIPRRGGKSKIFCLWSFLWSKTLLCRFLQSGKTPQTQASQGFAAFHLTPSRIPPRHSQSRRATNCATPGYFVILFGWSYSPKPGAIPASLYPDIQLLPLYHGEGRKAKLFLAAVIYVRNTYWISEKSYEGYGLM